jgi:hypothetical protein
MDSNEIAAVIEQVSRQVEEYYVFPEVAQRITAVLRSGRYPVGTDAAGLAALVTADLQSVNGDKHLRLRHHEAELAPDHGHDDADLERLGRYGELHSGGVATARRLPGNVGYLEIWPLLLPPSLAGAAVTAAMTLLAGTDALLIDVRRCRGGTPDMVAFLCSYLFDAEPVHLNGIYDRETGATRQFWSYAHVPGRRYGTGRPVWVLTGAVTFSGAEELAWDLQQRGRATIVGERTGGGAHPRRAFRVTAHLDVTIPDSRAVDPVSGLNWEGTGVRPDVEVAAAEACAVAYGMALEHVRTLGGAGERRETYAEALLAGGKGSAA